MNDIKYRNVRFDPNLTPFHKLAGRMADAFGYTSELSVDKELAQLLRLRVAQRNECAYCSLLHSQAARDAGIPQAKIESLPAWQNSGLFTEMEKTALVYCDVLTIGTHGNFQAYHDAMCLHFSEKEIAEIAAVVINMNVWTRLKLAQGQTPYWK